VPRSASVSTPDPLHPGLMIGKSVRLVRALGAGGMGSVWIADHLGLHTQVVVKFMARALADDADFVARFAREAAAASQVKSPHVVQMLDHGVSAEGLPYIVMEYLEGRDLAQRLSEQGRLPPLEVASVVTQVGKALARAHERGIVHRDVKPENIFLCDVGGGEVFVKLLDFGVAKGTGQLTSKTQTGTVIGSPQYMSPEQMLASKALDHRSDLWSLGVVAYEALTGSLPFDSETMAGLALQVHGEDPPRPSQRGLGLPPALDAWFARALAKSADARFSSAKEMCDAFARACDVHTDVVVATAIGTRSSVAPISSTRARLSHSVTEFAPPPPGGGRRWLVPAVAALLLFGLVVAFAFVRRQGVASSASSASTTAASASVVVEHPAPVPSAIAPAASSSGLVATPPSVAPPSTLPSSGPAVSAISKPGVKITPSSTVAPSAVAPPPTAVVSVAPKSSSSDPFGEARK